MMKAYDPESYWDMVAESIKERKDIQIIAGDDEPYYRYKRKQFLKLLARHDFANKTVLEVGCGPGGNLEFLSNRQCKKIIGVDVSNQMISLCKTFLKGKNIDVFKINRKDLPFRDASFDTVFTSTVLQHITDEEMLINLCREISRVSRDEVLLFERVENKVKGHETNVGRPIGYYRNLMHLNGFALADVKSLPIQASYVVCGIIRKLFNSSKRKEGEPLTSFSITMEKIALPFTSLLDEVIPSKRDVTFLKFKKRAP